MTKQITTLGIIILSLAFGVANTRARQADESIQEWHAAYTGFTEAKQLVIVKKEGFEQMWRALFDGRPVPAVDFEKSVVACVFLGQRPTGGYSVEFNQPFIRKDKWVIPFWEKVPTGFVTEALTQPCVMKVFARKDKLETILEKIEAPKTQKSPLLHK